MGSMDGMVGWAGVGCDGTDADADLVEMLKW